MKRFALAFLFAAAALSAAGQGAAPAPQAGAPAAQPPGPAPDDWRYAGNLVQNGDFEKNLVSRPDKGWSANTWRGMDADADSCPRHGPDAAVDGKKALHFQVKKTVNYSSSELNADDWDKFRKGGKVQDGKNTEEGPPGGEVVQDVPVRPGAKYAIRFRWRSSGLYFSGAPGRDRGEVVATFSGEWRDKRGEKIPADPAFPGPHWRKFQRDPKEGWETVRDPDFDQAARNKKEPAVLVAPPGAAFVRLRFSFVCRREKVKPEFWVDRFEFAELPEAPPEKPAPAVPPAR